MKTECARKVYIGHLNFACGIIQNFDKFFIRRNFKNYQNGSIGMRAVYLYPAFWEPRISN